MDQSGAQGGERLGRPTSTAPDVSTRVYRTYLEARLVVVERSEGVGGVEEVGVRRDIVLAAAAEHEGELDVRGLLRLLRLALATIARRAVAAPHRLPLELPPSGTGPRRSQLWRWCRALGLWPRHEVCAPMLSGRRPATVRQR
jgi:hypothetical protein